MNYNKDIYMKRLEVASEFQDVVVLNLVKRGIVLSNMSSKKYQIKVGENLQGFEIKFDMKYKETNNLYIEIAEKSHPDNENYVSSGIYRNDNTWIYCIGDYGGVFLIQKKVLVAMHKKDRFRLVENETKTSRGFLLPKSKADEYFTFIKFATS